ncbi:hypothetical protein C804_06504 [Lachnospiraceae bacterium A4]|jgi:hypothetical protein|nr:hypothetical protein C804_06504 [Lachnospiraceae bacterium A4]
MMENLIINRKFWFTKVIFVCSCIIIFFLISTVSKECQRYKAINAYVEFVEGKRSCMGEYILELAMPTGEPERRNATFYYIVDSTGDGLPELHVWGTYYTIITFRDHELTVLDSFCSSSAAGMYYLLENGMIVYQAYVKNVYGNYYHFFILDDSGNHMEKLSFGWEDLGDNYKFDCDDLYEFDDEICKREEWFEKIQGYLYIDENGREYVCDEADWKVYCEAR